MPPTNDPPHLHHDPLTTRTVVVAPGRAERPNELEGATIRCPFCAGNESLTPPDILRVPRASSEPWQARIVPNRFPIAIVGNTPAADAALQASQPRPAHGVHDVVIESPAHVRSILDIDSDDWRAVWELCRERLAMLADRDDIAWATVFKNSGAKAGASLEHVHSQLVGLDFVPPLIAAELAAAGRAVDPFGDLLRRAVADDQVVAEAGDLVAVVPPAPRQPFETWILPQSAEPFFHATSPDRVAALAALTQSLIARLDRLAAGADYNWWLHQLPHHARHADAGADGPHADGPVVIPARWHWHLEIMPRINGLAGFELGTGCHITTMTPHESARRLREA
jgi:UDPglucose--hexose-1-phosphate uridylyltransferase